jgi:DNA adenine methylase
MAPTEFNTYFEPFAGSARLFFALEPKRALLNDINRELMLVYRVLREWPRELHRRVAAIPPSSENYYGLRSVGSGSLGRMESAVRFIYLNRYCFNGVYRTNRRGEFNVPFGRRTGGLPEEEVFVACGKALRAARLRSGDFEECLQEAVAGDFVYVDPPYFREGRRAYGEYGYGVFSTGDSGRLFRELERLDRRGVRFILSYVKCGSVLRKAARWSVRGVRAPRYVAGFSSRRRMAEEILVWNY